MGLRVIHSERPDFDHDMSGLWCGIRQVLDQQLLRSAVFFKYNRPHHLSPVVN
jgi:hypothetical protein